MTLAPIVVKVGGSLYDWPDLAARLSDWVRPFVRQGTPLLVVPGGGPTADAIRRFDRDHGLGEETAHWLALRALTLNAHVLAALLPGAAVVETPEDAARLGPRRLLTVLDAHAFARDDERRPGRLPHTWAVTSDSLAARVADVAGARRLVLLKSVTVPGGMDWAEAARCGFVDELFAQVLARRATPFAVSAVNLRAWPPGPPPATGPGRAPGAR
jgi:5-(aminomethyl)-3-furanmethanol phosphate kinase